jgi:hypothetical protein
MRCHLAKAEDGKALRVTLLRPQFTGTNLFQIRGRIGHQRVAIRAAVAKAVAAGLSNEHEWSFAPVGLPLTVVPSLHMYYRRVGALRYGVGLYVFY